MVSSKFLYIALFIAVLTTQISCDVPNCKIHNSDGTRCVECNEGYNVISNGTCVLNDPNCAIRYFSDGSCLQCQTGYTKTGTSNGRCVNASKLCKTFQLDGNTCQSCYPGYCLLQGDCITGDSSCKTYDAACKCATCYYGQPVDGSCSN